MKGSDAIDGIHEILSYCADPESVLLDEQTEEGDDDNASNIFASEMQNEID